METPSFGSTFASVDSSADPAELRAYLADVCEIPAVAAAKRDSFDLLGAKPGSSVLDLGCGSGDDARELARIVGGGGSVVGVDSSRSLVSALQDAVAAAGPLEFVCADATDLPFAAGRFDACRADRTIQHVPDPERALREIARVTKPGGVVVVSEMGTALDLGGNAEAELARAILARFWTAEERRGWLGFMLPLLMTRAGLSELEVHRRRERLTSFREAALILRLEEMCAAAARDDPDNASAVRGWLDALAGDFERGRAALEAEFMHFRARRPL